MSTPKSEPGAEVFRGCGVALVTPFGEKGVDEHIVRQLVEFQIVEGIDAIVPCGSTGEAATMSADEQARVVEVVVESVGGRVPVVAGVGGSDTAVVARLARNAARAGADAILASAPPYNKPSQSGLVAHFREILNAADLPLVVYNVPGRTACNILPETIEALANDPRVVGVKEASGDISQIADLARRVGDRVAIYSGNDDQIVPVMSLGGRGVISVAANLAPRAFSRLARAYLEGEVEEARRLQLRYLPLIRTLFREPNPVPVKAAMKALGFEVGGVRLPLTPASDETLELLREQMREVGLVAEVGVS